MSTELRGYRLTTQIGTGAGSKIYTAVELKTGKMVAVKHVVRNTPEDDRLLAQTETEYEVGRRFNHSSLRRSYSIHRVR